MSRHDYVKNDTLDKVSYLDFEIISLFDSIQAKILLESNR